MERIVFQAEEKGACWRVIRLKPLDSGPKIPVVGILPEVEEGMELKVTGEWEVHPKHGYQFKARETEVLPPSTKRGVLKYLSSRAIRGIGPKLAERIVGHLGENAIERIERDPKALLEVPGIGRKKAGEISRALRKHSESRAAMVFLRGIGLGESLSRKVYERYGKDTVAAIRENPYRLARDVFGLGFSTADRIARSLGIPPDSPFRIQAGIVHVLRTFAEEGNTFLPYKELVESCAEKLRVERKLVEEGVEELAKMGEIAPVKGPCAPELGPAVYPTILWKSEQELALKIRELLGSGTRLGSREGADRLIDSELRQSGLVLEKEQMEALRTAVREPVSIITGGPGVGKTTLVKVLVSVAQRMRARVVLCAPTGRAAKRLSEASGMPAATIHRTLGYNPHKRIFERGAGNPLEADLIVVDEASMLDIQLASSFFNAVPGGASVVLVGDSNQLPSVGPGNVLKDLIESGRIPVATLTRIHRQAENSLIVKNAHRILNGEFPLISKDPEGDFFFIREESPRRVLDLVVSIVTERMPKAFGLDPIDQIQVLTPMYKGDAGADRLNEVLREKLIPKGRELKKGWKSFRKGDKVLQVKNDYDRELFNGDLGRVVSVDTENESMIVRFESRDIQCSGAELDMIIPAFAVSVHRAQGSEFPGIVFPLTTQHFMMLKRNLFYTAVTRARRVVVLVGQPKALSLAVSRAETEKRYSGLAWRLGSRG